MIESHAVDKIHIGLTQQKAKELFEAQFGVDHATRTRKQWKALVKQYGTVQVCKIENMTVKEVKAKCKNV